MKPRIVPTLSNGIAVPRYACFYRGLTGQAMGYGDTPADAYSAWRWATEDTIRLGRPVVRRIVVKDVQR